MLLQALDPTNKVVDIRVDASGAVLTTGSAGGGAAGATEATQLTVKAAIDAVKAAVDTTNATLTFDAKTVQVKTAVDAANAAITAALANKATAADVQAVSTIINQLIVSNTEENNDINAALLQIAAHTLNAHADALTALDVELAENTLLDDVNTALGTPDDAPLEDDGDDTASLISAVKGVFNNTLTTDLLVAESAQRGAGFWVPWCSYYTIICVSPGDLTIGGVGIAFDRDMTLVKPLVRGVTWPAVEVRSGEFIAVYGDAI